LIIDEDFLLNKKRAWNFATAFCRVASSPPFCLLQHQGDQPVYGPVDEILEMGIDGFWVGYEGTRSAMAKQQGRPVPEISRNFASMASPF